MDYASLLTKAGVPQELHQEALDSLNKAKKNAKWLNTKKWYVRLFKANKISKMLSWDNNRLIEVAPDKLHWDIAPMKNITANGDNGPWIGPVGSDVPVEAFYTNPDPESEDYKHALEACYWSRGNHPRSRKARKDWYRRNAGEGLAYSLGETVDTEEQLTRWIHESDDEIIHVCKSGKSWILLYERKLIGKIWLESRMGFECDNVFSGDYSPQMWYPIDGFELKAPCTWSTRPRIK